jgi:hypothetical protein
MICMGDRDRRRDAEAVRITTVAPSRDVDTSARQRRYLASMGVRTACFIGAVAVGGGWLRWVLLGAAVLLPYVAVVAANAVAGRPETVDLPDPGNDLRHLHGPDPESGSEDQSLS